MVDLCKKAKYSCDAKRRTFLTLLEIRIKKISWHVPLSHSQPFPDKTVTPPPYFGQKHSDTDKTVAPSPRTEKREIRLVTVRHLTVFLVIEFFFIRFRERWLAENRVKKQFWLRAIQSKTDKAAPSYFDHLSQTATSVWNIDHNPGVTLKFLSLGT